MNNNNVCGVCHYVALTAADLYAHAQRKKCIPRIATANNFEVESSSLSPMDDIMLDDVDMTGDVEMTERVEEAFLDEGKDIYIYIYKDQ